MEEKRRSKRMEIDVSIKMRGIESPNIGQKRVYDVDVINISRGGIGFRCDKKLEINAYYDCQIVIWTGEKLDTVIQILRENHGEYGAQFIGMAARDKMKIEIYELFNATGEDFPNR